MKTPYDRWCYTVTAHNSRPRKDRLGNTILFKLTFDEWWDIWSSSGHYDDIGRVKGKFCMSRKDDIGHYEVGNVFIQLTSLNSRESALNNLDRRGAKMSDISKAKIRIAKAGIPLSAAHRDKLARFDDVTALQILSTPGTQHEVAQQFGCSRMTVSNIKRGIGHYAHLKRLQND